MSRTDLEIVRDAIRESYYGHSRAVQYVDEALNALDRVEARLGRAEAALRLAYSRWMECVRHEDDLSLDEQSDLIKIRAVLVEQEKEQPDE